MNIRELTLKMFQENLTSLVLWLVCGFIGPQVLQGCSSVRWWSSRQRRCSSTVSNWLDDLTKMILSLTDLNNESKLTERRIRIQNRECTENQPRMNRDWLLNRECPCSSFARLYIGSRDKGWLRCASYEERISRWVILGSLISFV